MPFGQVNSGATFLRLMEVALGELLFKCLVYVDDIIVYSSSIDDQLRRLKKFFLKLTENNLRLMSENCYFFQTEVSFMAYTVTPNGIKKDDKKIEAIPEWPVPKNVKELKRFLGLTEYMRKYVSHYTQWVNPGLLYTTSNEGFLYTHANALKAGQLVVQ